MVLLGKLSLPTPPAKNITVLSELIPQLYIVFYINELKGALLLPGISSNKTMDYKFITTIQINSSVVENLIDFKYPLFWSQLEIKYFLDGSEATPLMR